MHFKLVCFFSWLKTCLFIQSLQNSSFNHFSAIYCLLLERVMKHQALQQNKLGTEWLKEPCHTPQETVLPLEDDLSTLKYTCSASAACQLETTVYQESQVGHLKKEEKEDQALVSPSVESRKSQRHTPPDASASQKFSCLPSKFKGISKEITFMIHTQKYCEPPKVLHHHNMYMFTNVFIACCTKC